MIDVVPSLGFFEQRCFDYSRDPVSVVPIPNQFIPNVAQFSQITDPACLELGDQEFFIIAMTNHQQFPSTVFNINNNIVTAIDQDQQQQQSEQLVQSNSPHTTTQQTSPQMNDSLLPPFSEPSSPHYFSLHTANAPQSSSFLLTSTNANHRLLMNNFGQPANPGSQHSSPTQPSPYHSQPSSPDFPNFLPQRITYADSQPIQNMHHQSKHLSIDTTTAQYGATTSQTQQNPLARSPLIIRPLTTTTAQSAPSSTINAAPSATLNLTTTTITNNNNHNSNNNNNDNNSNSNDNMHSPPIELISTIQQASAVTTTPTAPEPITKPQFSYSGPPKSYYSRLPLYDRPFKCDECPQSFNRNHDLKRHKRIHLAVKPYPCPYCEKQFSRKDALKRHILVKGCNNKTSTSVQQNGEPSSTASRQQRYRYENGSQNVDAPSALPESEDTRFCLS